MHAESQDLVIKSDTDCILKIDGLKKRELNANEEIEIPVSEGEHILLAVTRDKKLHFRDVVEIYEGKKYNIEISFQPVLAHGKKIKRKQEKRQTNIETYYNLKSGIINEIRDNMILIRGGDFEMGTSEGKQDEQPERNVFLDDYYISKYEVTQKQWMAVMGNNPGFFYDCTGCPVENVHWYNAIVFCNQLSRLSGLSPYYSIDSVQTDTNNHNFYDHLKWTITIHEDANGYRLPTEAEWEFAAAGHTDYLYAGSNIADKVAWTLENSNSSIHPVGQKEPNTNGLFDMSGNVWEWCYDWYSPNYYSKGKHKNPSGPSVGRLRVIRGGGWMAHQMHARVRNRDRDGADNKNYFTGFRIVRNHKKIQQ